jgi:hypothetical protein
MMETRTNTSNVVEPQEDNRSVVDLRPFLPPGQLTEEFDVTIKARRRKPDRRRRVKDPVALERFVDAVVAGDLSSLSPARQAVGRAILGSLLKKPSRTIVVKQLASLRRHEWAGIRASTLRDNILRKPGGPRGQASRTKRARKKSLRND